MKKFMVFLLLGFLTLAVQAQWYSRSYGVKSINELTQPQLNYELQRAQSNIKAGKILTYSGVGAFALGTFIAASSLDNGWWRDDNDFDKYVAGSMLMLLGMGATAVGVPFWIVGASREKKVEIALLRFDSSVFTGLRQPEQMGLSLKINF
ncbi:hypothetical protein OU798_10050 [Prolixibacteraceae bacterium Z1-6]|uniref:Uncharacterized protein n=1 Tax=Draconibacterium aestuarii TaxID=2998507 RepID=A0A9X3F8F2_9BACT|nr:hypothetical protein [Prolixibacteraceae bacterium Z1-6]